MRLGFIGFIGLIGFIGFLPELLATAEENSTGQSKGASHPESINRRHELNAYSNIDNQRVYAYIYIYMCVCVCVYIYIHIYIYRERERERES